MALQIYKASAGSGKTFTLAVEYIALLAEDPTAYRNILAVTFTNKATAEMKQRILSTLYGMAQGLASADKYMDAVMTKLTQGNSQLSTINSQLLRRRAKEALENIIHDYSRFHVETIDSFFQGIVRELANELELSTNLKVELNDEDVLSEAVDRIVENLREESSEFRTIIDFIEEKIRENHAWQVEETVKEFGKNIFKENYLIHGEEMRRKITDHRTIGKYRDVINTLLEEKKRAVTDLGERMLKA